MHWLLAAMGGAVAACLALWLQVGAWGSRLRLLAALEAVRSGGEAPPAPATAPRTRRPSASLRQVGRGVVRILFRGRLQRWARRSLQGAGLPLRPEEFLGLTAAGAPGGYLLGSVLPLPGFVRLLLVLAGFAATPLAVRRARQRRVQSISTQLAGALLTLGNGLRAGHSLLQAMGAAAEQTPVPLGEELGHLLREISGGIPVDEALERLVERTANPDLELLITAIRVQREVGGNLAEVLDRISATIRARVEVQAHLRVVTAQSRLSAWVVGLLPVGVFAITTVVAPTVSAVLVHDPVGRLLAGAAVAMELGGLFVISRIVRVRY